MTDRIYYNDAYQVQFDATVLEEKAEGGRAMVRLDRSAFYPTSGGQPFDTGSLGNVQVLDAFVSEDGEVWHVIGGRLAIGEAVEGKIDWARRFDHMQQHAGEHMLAGAIWRKTGGHTIGLHLGAEVSTIDVQMPDGSMRVPETLLDELEDEVNGLIQQDLPIRCWFPSRPELKQLPLRKPPAVFEHIRVVAIGQEMVACGGTHPSSTGQIGLLKILDARPSKGKMRITFVCGMRAFHDYRSRANAAQRAAEALSTSVMNLPAAVERMQGEAREAVAVAARLRREVALNEIGGLLDRAEILPDGWRIVCARFDAYDMKTLRDVAAALVEAGNVYALLASTQIDGALLLFARSDVSPLDMGKLLAETARAHGGKGGGRPDFAQGSATDAAAIEEARKNLRKIHTAPEK